MREVLSRIDKQCQQRKLGPYLDKSSQYWRMRPEAANTSCDILFLKSNDPLLSPEGRFAQSLTLPASLHSSRASYRSGMTGKEYFDALCAAEAGDFVISKRGDIDGIIQLRPSAPSYSGMESLIAGEAPSGPLLAQGHGKPGRPGGTQDRFIQPPQGRYDFFERSIVPADRVDSKVALLRFFRGEPVTPKAGRWRSEAGQVSWIPYVVHHELAAERRSRYGYTWRGVEREMAREHGILIGELIILDLQTQEILGVRRHMVRQYFHESHLTSRTMFSEVCSFSLRPGKARGHKSGFEFVYEVLAPARGSE